MKARKLLRKLNYLPRGAWYLFSLFIGGPIGPVLVYFLFRFLQNVAEDEQEEELSRAFDWAVDIDREGIHMHSRKGAKQDDVYEDDEVRVSGAKTESRESVEKRWARTEQNARNAYAGRRHAEPIGENAGVDEVIRQGRDALRTIRRANDMIPDPALTAQIDSIENSCSQILSILEQRPQLLNELRTFLRYYLPTTLDLLDARAKLDKGATTPKAREVRQRISEALGVVDKAFQKQVEALDEYRFIDLESEMDVLSDMLKADGLIDNDEKKESDPFADVLSAREEARKNKQQGTPMGGH